MPHFHYIVVGSGIAGLTSALCLSKKGSVAVITKGKIQEGSTNLAQGGIVAVADANDSVALHVQDTLRAGAYHNKKSAVEVMSNESREAVKWLEGLGVPFDRDKRGNYAYTLEGAHSRKRTVHATDFTGRAIEDVLVKRVRANSNITVLERHFCVDLVRSNGKCVGLTYLHDTDSNNKNRSIRFMPAASVILATGGLGQVYEWTTNPKVATGDGIALAKRAGAVLTDMEFIQFHPTALKHGKSPLFLLSEALRGEGAHVVDSGGGRFLFDKLEEGELGSRDQVTRLIHEKQKTSEVYLDMRHKYPLHIKSRFSNIYKRLKKEGYDLTRDIIPITPAAHYSCGGISTDLNGLSSVENLYAVGEVACTGVQGANRLASNSLLEGVVFGRRVAQKIAKDRSSLRAVPQAQKSRNKLEHGFKHDERALREIRAIERSLKKLMWSTVGIIRRREDLKKAQLKLKRMGGRIERLLQLNAIVSRELYEVKINVRPKYLVYYLQVKNMVEAALAITNAALARKKSLGVHYVK